MLPRQLPVIDALCAVRAGGAKIKIIKKLLLPVLAPYALLARVGNNKDKLNLKHLISSVELLKLITCGKPRRATKGADVRRFCGDAPRSFERTDAHKMHARPLAASPTK